MNRASIDFAWTRKSGGSPTGLSRIARKGRARTGFAIPAAMILLILSVACIRQATPTRPDSALISFQGPGTFTKRDSENLKCAALILMDIQPDIKTVKKNTEATYRLAKGELPGVMK